jgi:hypothetical protein
MSVPFIPPLILSCRTNTKPIAVDGSIGDNDYPKAVRCSGTAKPPAGDRFKLVSVDVWFEQLFSGLQMTECAAEAAT